MQLPLSASALVMLGLGAVLVGATILVVVAVRRRKPASGRTRIPPDMRRPPAPVATSGAHFAERAAVDSAAWPHIQAAAAPPASVEPVPASAEPTPVPVPVPVEQTPKPAVPPAPQPSAAPVAAASMPRPMEVSSRVDPPAGGGQVPPDPTPPAEVPAAAVRHHQAGSGRTVAAAVAQAFAVRAAAGRAGVQRPVGPPPPGAGAPAAQASPAPQAEPDPGPRAVDDVDPAATTEPDDLGVAPTAVPGPEAEPPAVEANAPDPTPSGEGWAHSAAYRSNGDHSPDGNGQPPEAAADGNATTPAAGAGLPAAGWPVPAAPTQPEPEAAVPAPRPDNDGVAQQGAPPTDARDRLLAVLLDDPERAVGAAVELEACLGELDRLSDAVRTGRAALRDVLHRLATAGLRPDQLARLARLPHAEVQELLAAAPAEQQA